MEAERLKDAYDLLEWARSLDDNRLSLQQYLERRVSYPSPVRHSHKKRECVSQCKAEKGHREVPTN